MLGYILSFFFLLCMALIVLFTIIECILIVFMIISFRDFDKWWSMDEENLQKGAQMVLGLLSTENGKHHRHEGLIFLCRVTVSQHVEMKRRYEDQRDYKKVKDICNYIGKKFIHIPHKEMSYEEAFDLFRSICLAMNT